MTAFSDSSPVRRALELDIVQVMWWRELVRYGRDRSQMFGGLSRTLLWLVVLGFGLGATLREIEGYSYAQYILPGVVILNVLFASLQSAMALVWDRQTGLMREVLTSPAPMLSVVLGKVAGGATVAVIQGSIPLAFAPLLGFDLSLAKVLMAWAVMASTGVTITAVGIVIACRSSAFESFGSVSNGVIQPLYFLSGAIFPLKGIVGGAGFLDIPASLRAELRRYGVYAIGGGWVVELPDWLKLLVHLNPVSYPLDLLRLVLLGFGQLPLAASLCAVTILPAIMLAVAARSMAGLRQP
ncbi:ABC transporter permease [Prosthecomicrobium sp. N25]|uniref:ABC transporter permease n=1 Tax=Prosthecomicrobium sp. N25 TaxID=3129254 RepID=UPI003077A23C